MNRRIFTRILAATTLAGMTGIATAQTATVLNAFDADIEGWQIQFNTDSKVVAGPTWDGVGGIDIDVTGDGGTNTVGISDAFNNTGVFPPTGSGGVSDFYGLDGLEYDISVTTTGTPGTESIAFYLNGRGQNFSFGGLGSQSITTDGTPATIVVPFSAIASPDIPAFVSAVPIYGIQVNPPSGDTWTIKITEVRSYGAGVAERYLGRFNDTNINGGLDGVRIGYRADAIVNGFTADPGSAGVGFTHVPGAGVDGAIEFIIEENGGSGGPGVVFFQGIDANTEFRSRPLDLSNYTRMDAVVSCDSTDGSTPYMKHYVQTTSGFNFQDDGAQTVNLPDDGQFATYTFDISALVDMNNVQRLGLEFGESASGQTATIRIDTIRLYSLPSSVTDWQTFD